MTETTSPDDNKEGDDERKETEEENNDKKKRPIYTKKGDEGKSTLYNLEKRLKSDDVFEALGDCDETNVAVGLARVHVEKDTVETFRDVLGHLEIVQSRLLDCGSAIATPLTSKNTNDSLIARIKFEDGHCAKLEEWMDKYDEELPKLTNFLCPGGTKFSAFLHQARATCRRCERRVAPMVKRGDVEPTVLQYLNRLSDFLFIVARIANKRVNVEDIAYVKALATVKIL